MIDLPHRSDDPRVRHTVRYAETAPAIEPAPRQYTLARTGGVPILFVGAPVAQAVSEPERGPKHRERWHVVTIYRTRARKSWIVQIQYRTTWQHERDETTVSIVRALDEATAARKIGNVLRAYEPPVTGYPPHAEYDDRQDALLARHDRDWAALITAVLGQLPASTEVIQ